MFLVSDFLTKMPNSEEKRFHECGTRPNDDNLIFKTQWETLGLKKWCRGSDLRENLGCKETEPAKSNKRNAL